MTDRTPSIFEALSLVMGDVRAVGKDGWNDNQKFKFRGIDAVVNAVAPALRKHGVLISPELLEIEYRDVKTTTGKPARECTLKVQYTFWGPDGSKFVTVVPGEAMDSADKGTAKAMSVAFRIALLQALALPTDDTDPDVSYLERDIEDSLPTKAYLELSAEVDRSDNREKRKLTYAMVTAARKHSVITVEEADDLYGRLIAANEAAARQVVDETPVTVQRRTPDGKAHAVPYSEHPVGPQVDVELPGWPDG